MWKSLFSCMETCMCAHVHTSSVGTGRWLEGFCVLHVQDGYSWSYMARGMVCVFKYGCTKNWLTRELKIRKLEEDGWKNNASSVKFSYTDHCPKVSFVRRRSAWITINKLKITVGVTSRQQLCGLIIQSVSCQVSMPPLPLDACILTVCLCIYFYSAPYSLRLMTDRRLCWQPAFIAWCNDLGSESGRRGSK